MLVAADAYKRAGSTDPKALADAIRTDQHHKQCQPRPRHPVQRKGKRQAEDSAIQNRGGKLVDGGAEGSGQRQSRNGR